MEWLVPGLIVVFIIVLVVYLLVKSQEPAPKPTTTSRSAAQRPPEPDEDDGTQVRIVGHRLVRLAGGLRVGTDVPIVSVVTIGRGRNCTLALNDPEMSHVHAEIRIESGVAYIADQGSTNGTLLNDVALVPNAPKQLSDGDHIKMGSTTLMYKSHQ